MKYVNVYVGKLRYMDNFKEYICLTPIESIRCNTEDECLATQRKLEAFYENEDSCVVKTEDHFAMETFQLIK
jgi:hypothetical protein